MEIEKFISPAQAAELMGVNKNDFDKFRQAGLIRVLKKGRVHKIRVGEFNEFARWLDGKDITDPYNVIDLATGQTVTRF